jgi:lipopolysaccharide/colanic/teichoic acid biosynthesis glycosyltransferase
MPSELLSGFVQSRSRGWPPTAARQEPRVIAEELFKVVLKNERKRADRCNQPFVLLIVAVDGQPAPGSSFIWKPVIETLGTLIRETDVMGWLAWRAAIGIILTEIRALDAAARRELEARISRELVTKLDAETAGKFSVRLHVHSEQKQTGEEALWPADPQGTTYDAIKRGLDVIVSLALLLVLSPLFFLIGALVKWGSGGRGPVFFGQVRIGQKTKPFTMLKFRTMKVDADPKLHLEFVTNFIKSSGQGAAAPQNVVFKLTNDPRVTPVGRILRKTSLDELPQLLNVLRGDMSLVGPRPPLPYEFKEYKPWHCRRVLEAKPGITGLWQVKGRSRTTFDDMVRLDLRYARTYSLRTDIKILLATPRAVFSGKGAC